MDHIGSMLIEGLSGATGLQGCHRGERIETHRCRVADRLAGSLASATSFEKRRQLLAFLGQLLRASVFGRQTLAGATSSDCFAYEVTH
jgi:hypothetical protein